MDPLLNSRVPYIETSMMSIYNLLNEPYYRFPSLLGNSSVYVISDSEMARYKRAQTEAEILELQRLIDGHKTSIENLEKTIELLRKELPEEPEQKQALPAD